MSDPSPSLRLENVSRRYGRKPVLQAVNHAFPRGLTLLTGPSGAGKSTLLRLCATAEKPSGGALFWEGKALPAPAAGCGVRWATRRNRWTCPRT